MPAKKELKKEVKVKMEEMSQSQKKNPELQQEINKKRRQKRANKGPFRRYLKRLFKQTKPDVITTKDALQISEDITLDIIQKIIDTISDLSKFKKSNYAVVQKKDKQGNILEGEENTKKIRRGKTIKVQEIITAIKLVLPRIMQADAIDIFNITIQDQSSLATLNKKK